MRNSTSFNGPHSMNQVVTRSKDAMLDPSKRSSTRPAFHRFISVDNTQNDALSSQQPSDIEDNEDGRPAGRTTRSTFDNNTASNTLNNTQDIFNSQSSPVRPRRRTAGSNAAAAVGASPGPFLSPFGESHNRRSGNLRRARASGSAHEKSRKRRSIDKPSIPEPSSSKLITAAARGYQRPKPRASAPSRIPAPIKVATAAPIPVQPASLTPERSQSDTEGLVKLGEASLKKLSIEELGPSPRKPSSCSPSFSSPDASPSTHKTKMMNPLSHQRHSSDLFESFFTETPEQPKLKPLPVEFRPTHRGPSTFQRQISQATVLFGGPAILSPAPEQLPPSSSQTNPGDDDDGFFTPPSPIKAPPPPSLAEPTVVKKFKPRDSGVVVSDESDTGSPVKRTLPPILNAMPGRLQEGMQDRLTPSTRVARRSSVWPAGMGLPDKSGTDQTALKVLFEKASNMNEKEKRPRTPVKRSSAAHMFSSVPRMRPTLAPSLANKGIHSNLSLFIN